MGDVKRAILRANKVIIRTNKLIEKYERVIRLLTPVRETKE